MPNKFQAIDSRGKVHKRTSENRTYTHCVVIHFGWRPANTYFAESKPHDRAEWAGSLLLAEKNAAVWRGKSSGMWIDGVEILTAERG